MHGNVCHPARSPTYVCSLFTTMPGKFVHIQALSLDFPTYEMGPVRVPLSKGLNGVRRTHKVLGGVDHGKGSTARLSL